MHKEAVACNLRLHGEVSSTANVETHLSSTFYTNQIENTKHLKLIILTVRLLSTQGLAFRVHKEDDRKFNAALEMCVEAAGENFALNEKECSAPSIQNKITNIFMTMS